MTTHLQSSTDPYEQQQQQQQEDQEMVVDEMTKTHETHEQQQQQQPSEPSMTKKKQRKPYVKKEKQLSTAVNEDDEEKCSTNIKKESVISEEQKRDIERYKQLDARAHLYKRPDTVIGSVVPTETPGIWIVRMDNDTPLLSSSSSVASSTNLSSQQQQEQPTTLPTIIEKTITLTPGFVRIVDELLVNAADNAVRSAQPNKRPMTYIKIHVSDKQISVENDGEVVPIEKHHLYENKWVPQLMFCEMLSSSNYDDDEKRTVGGRNGYGAKASNIMSLFYKIQISNGKKVYVQTCSNNMQIVNSPIIEEKEMSAFTKITMKPEYRVFGMGVDDSLSPETTTLPSSSSSSEKIEEMTNHKMQIISDDVMGLLQRRAYDLAATTGLDIYFNGKLVPVHSFREYVACYFPPHHFDSPLPKKYTLPINNKNNPTNQDDDDDENDDDDANDGNDDDSENTNDDATSNVDDEENPKQNINKKKGKQNNNHFSTNNEKKKNHLFFIQPHDRWQIAIASSEKYHQMSFVNNINTSKGGRHVKAVTDQICEYASKRLKRPSVTWREISKNIWLFVDATIEKPTFDSQSKECLTCPPSTFGSTFQLSQAFLKNIYKHIIQPSLQDLKDKQNASFFNELNASNKRVNLTLIPKLVDAEYAANKTHAKDCTLILTEGDSAKALAEACVASQPSKAKYFGIFPLRGKMTNERDSLTDKDTSLEQERIVQIMGLEYNKEYETTKGLRYGHIMAFTDSDLDGHHICGLIISFLEHHWPSLCKIPNFLSRFISPIVKASKTINKKTKVISFRTLQELDEWKAATPDASTYSLKYYKGLGTSSPEEGREYFANFERYHVTYTYDGTEDHNMLNVAMSRASIQERKQWLDGYDMHQTNSIDYGKLSGMQLSIAQFVNGELRPYAIANNLRSLPCVVDGLKPSQRKILCGTVHYTEHEIRVDNLCGHIGETTAYHHGEASLGKAIVKMAQDYIGANNIPLLIPSGQFGTRSEPDSNAQSRYIFTMLSPIARALFPAIDDKCLTYEYDDGKQIQPCYYVPILPFVLFNGVDGIGTGYKSEIPPFNPLEILENTRRLIHNEAMVEMDPWFRGFTGTVSVDRTTCRVMTSGRVVRKVPGQYMIEEVPIDVSAIKYKEYLDDTVSHYADNNMSSITIESNNNNNTFTDSSTNNNNSTTTSTNKNVKKPKNTGNNNNNNNNAAGKKKNKKKNKTILKFPFLRAQQITDVWRIRFVIYVSPEVDEQLAQMSEEQLLKAFCLVKCYCRMSNMIAVDQNYHICRYNSPLDMIREFAPVRYQMYEKRKQYMLQLYESDYKVARERVRFINLLRSKTIVIENISRDVILEQLTLHGFESTIHHSLMNTHLWDLTKEHITKLEKIETNAREKYERCEATSCKDMWLEDLDVFEKEYRLASETYLNRHNLTAIDDEDHPNDSDNKKPEKKIRKPKKTNQPSSSSSPTDESATTTTTPTKKTKTKQGTIRFASDISSSSSSSSSTTVIDTNDALQSDAEPPLKKRKLENENK